MCPAAVASIGQENFSAACAGQKSGTTNHIAGPYLLRYAQEASWREDCRRMSNGEQVNRVVGLTMAAKTSVDFVWYWQRHVKSL
jgi:hypothetical protein